MQSTDTPQLATDAPQVTAPGTLPPSVAQSPFGPQRKGEEQPPTIPGQRKAADVGPRPPFPAAPTRSAPLGHDLTFDRGAYDEAYDRLQHSDRYDRHAARDAFGADLPRGAA